MKGSRRQAGGRRLNVRPTDRRLGGAAHLERRRKRAVRDLAAETGVVRQRLGMTALRPDAHRRIDPLPVQVDL